MNIGSKFRTVWLLVTAVLALQVFVFAAKTEAQAPSVNQVSEAREFFERGVQLADEGRWAEALEAFRASLSRVDRASTVFNLANALVRTGRFVEARTVLTAYLRRPEIRDDRQKREQADRLLQTAREGIAVMRLTLNPENSVVKIDGEASALSGSPRELELDPGEHVIEVAAEGYQPFSRRFSLQSGNRLERAVDLLPAPVVVDAREPDPLAPATDRSTGSRSVFKSPWFWVASGAVVLAGAAVGTYFLVQNAQEEPEVYGGQSGVVITVGGN